MTMAQIFVFIVNEELHSICESFESAIKEEHYLNTKANNVDCFSIIGNSIDACWQLVKDMF